MSNLIVIALSVKLIRQKKSPYDITGILQYKKLKLKIVTPMIIVRSLYTKYIHLQIVMISKCLWIQDVLPVMNGIIYAIYIQVEILYFYIFL